MAPPRERLPLRVSAAFAASGAWVLPLAACQLLGGIDGIELVAPDAGGRGDASVHGDADRDAHDGPHEAGTPDTGYDSQPAGTPCSMGSVCVPESTFLGPEGMANSYCGGEAGALACGGAAACCPGNPNGHGTTGGLCPGAQAVCAGTTCTPCGSSGYACCVAAGDGGEACPGNPALVCDVGTCATCGQPGQPCCLGGGGGFPPFGGLCQPSAVCSREGTCVLCNEECTKGCCDPVRGCVDIGATCTNGLTCKEISCDMEATAPMCGVAGRPCCTGGICRDGSLCGDSGACERCGGVGGACCPGGDSGKVCASGLVCDNAGTTCVACGGAGQTCCPGDTCSAGTCNPVTNQCDPGLGCGGACGGAGQPCCPSSVATADGGTSPVGACAPAMCCDVTVDAGPTNGVCRLSGSACGNGSVCQAGGCQPCGTKGMVCCAGSTCSGGDAAQSCVDGGVCM